MRSGIDLDGRRKRHHVDRSDEPLQRRECLEERVGRMGVREGEAEVVAYTRS